MKKIAVIGTGIAGMSAAYFLSAEHDVHVFEKNDYVGGHTNTVTVSEKEKDIPIDTGFMVFNEVTYPNLLKLFHKLNVPYYNTDMSFGVQHKPSKLEYTGSGIPGLFAQRKNILNISYIKMLLQINKFNKTAPIHLQEEKYKDYSIKKYVEENGYGEEFYQKFLVPMSSAVWSTPPNKMDSFPAMTLIRFFYNHGFLGLDTQHQWKTVEGGSKTYRDILIKNFQDKIKINSKIVNVKLEKDKVILKDQNRIEYNFDYVVFATHADEILPILENPTPKQENLLSPFSYQENLALLHSDESVMPKTKRAWASWNYIITNEKTQETYTVYYMNKLQNVSKKQNYFININGESYVNPKKVIKKIIYHHPVFSIEAIRAQKELFGLNTDDSPIYFCGSYFRYGFHEDALLSSINLCNHILNKEVL